MSRSHAAGDWSSEDEARAVRLVHLEDRDSEFEGRRRVDSEQLAGTPDFNGPEPFSCFECRGLQEHVLMSSPQQLSTFDESEEESMDYPVEYSIKRFSSFDWFDEDHWCEDTCDRDAGAAVCYTAIQEPREPQVWVPVMVPVELAAPCRFWGSPCCLVSASTPIASAAPAVPLCFMGSPAAAEIPLAPSPYAPGAHCMDGQPSPSRPVHESLTHSFCITNGIFSISWRVDARKLKGSNQCLVSPEFKLCFKSMSDPAAFKLIIRPKQSNSSSGRCSFAKSKGIGLVFLKSENTLSGPEARVKFCIAVGKNSTELTKRGPVSHHFASHPVGQLSKDQEEWNFKSLADPSSTTVLICLEIMPNSAPTLEEETSLPKPARQDVVSSDLVTPTLSDASCSTRMSETNWHYQLHPDAGEPVTQMSCPIDGCSKMKGRGRSEQGRQHQFERWRERLGRLSGRCRSEKGHQRQLERWHKRREVYRAKKAPAIEGVEADKDVVGEDNAQAIEVAEADTFEPGILAAEMEDNANQFLGM